jgi:hypothetical protein
MDQRKVLAKQLRDFVNAQPEVNNTPDYSGYF